MKAKCMETALLRGGYETKDFKEEYDIMTEGLKLASTSKNKQVAGGIGKKEKKEVKERVTWTEHCPNLFLLWAECQIGKTSVFIAFLLSLLGRTQLVIPKREPIAYPLSISHPYWYAFSKEGSAKLGRSLELKASTVAPSKYSVRITCRFLLELPGCISR
mmetsp:Transcript_9947/g.26374  ORF Transcript_9947/g.26374 Transcript_9947/m.26374 type:complete len:160 (-) Transcript_9947:443-922(-)